MTEPTKTSIERAKHLLSAWSWGQLDKRPEMFAFYQDRANDIALALEEAAAAERERKSVLCAFCSFEIPAPTTVGVLQKHVVEECQEHPLRKMLAAERRAAQEVVEAARQERALSAVGRFRRRVQPLGGPHMTAPAEAPDYVKAWSKAHSCEVAYLWASFDYESGSFRNASVDKQDLRAGYHEQAWCWKKGDGWESDVPDLDSAEWVAGMLRALWQSGHPLVIHKISSQTYVSFSCDERESPPCYGPTLEAALCAAVLADERTDEAARSVLA
mgnify:CR=1 FL=1